MSGTLGQADSAIEAVFETDDLLPWNDFINRLRGEHAEPKVHGRAFQLARTHDRAPARAHLFRPRERQRSPLRESVTGTPWKEISLTGRMAFASSGARRSRGPSSAQFELSCSSTTGISMRTPPGILSATLVRTDTDGLQAVLGWSYPVHGLLSGTFHGGGTRASPEMEGLFDVVEPEAWGWRFDRARGQIALRRGEVRIANAELRLLPPPAPNGALTSAPAGVLTGNFLYHTSDGQISFDLTGAVVPLEGIARIQTPRLPIGGQMSFRLEGDGPLLAPRIEGSLRLVNLRLGSDVLGSFQSRITSDGTQLTLQVDSEISAGEVHGRAQVALRGDYPVTGQVTVRQVDLDALSPLRSISRPSPATVAWMENLLCPARSCVLKRWRWMPIFPASRSAMPT